MSLAMSDEDREHCWEYQDYSLAAPDKELVHLEYHSSHNAFPGCFLHPCRAHFCGDQSLPNPWTGLEQAAADEEMGHF